MVRITVNYTESFEYELNDSLLEYLKERGVDIKNLEEIKDFMYDHGVSYNDALYNYARICDEVNMTVDED